MVSWSLLFFNLLGITSLSVSLTVPRPLLPLNATETPDFVKSVKAHDDELGRELYRRNEEEYNPIPPIDKFTQGKIVEAGGGGWILQTYNGGGVGERKLRCHARPAWLRAETEVFWGPLEYDGRYIGQVVTKKRDMGYIHRKDGSREPDTHAIAGAQLQASLNGISGIVEVYDYFVAREYGHYGQWFQFTVMDGVGLQFDLWDIVNPEGLRLRVFTPNKIKEVIGELIGVVAAMHKEGVAHRQLTATNVMYVPECVRIIDFSMATRREKVTPEAFKVYEYEKYDQGGREWWYPKDEEEEYICEPGSCPPEFWNYEDYGPFAWDVFQLGILIVFMLCLPEAEGIYQFDKVIRERSRGSSWSDLDAAQLLREWFQEFKTPEDIIKPTCKLTEPEIKLLSQTLCREFKHINVDGLKEGWAEVFL